MGRNLIPWYEKLVDIGKPILEGSSQGQKRSTTQILTLSDPKTLKVSPVKNSQKIVVFRRLEALQFRAALGLRGGLGESSFAEGSGESRLPVAPPRVPPAFR